MNELDNILSKIDMTTKELKLVEEINKEAEIYQYHKRIADTSIKTINDKVEKLRKELIFRYSNEKNTNRNC